MGPILTAIRAGVAAAHAWAMDQFVPVIACNQDPGKGCVLREFIAS